MKTVALIAVGLVFPPVLALHARTPLLFFLAAQAAILVLFFFVAWGPAVFLHGLLWIAGIRLCLSRRGRGTQPA